MIVKPDFHRLGECDPRRFAEPKLAFFLLQPLHRVVFALEGFRGQLPVVFIQNRAVRSLAVFRRSDFNHHFGSFRSDGGSLKQNGRVVRL